MPSASRNANRKRRARRNISLLKRAVQTETITRAKVTVVMFAVLNKLGGEIELSKTDLDTAALSMSKLSFVIEPSAVEGNFMVRLVALTETAPETTTTVGTIPAEEEVIAEPEDVGQGEARAIADEVQA